MSSSVLFLSLSLVVVAWYGVRHCSYRSASVRSLLGVILYPFPLLPFSVLSFSALSVLCACPPVCPLCCFACLSFSLSDHHVARGHPGAPLKGLQKGEANDSRPDVYSNVTILSHIGSQRCRCFGYSFRVIFADSSRCIVVMYVCFRLACYHEHVFMARRALAVVFAGGLR